MTAISLLLVSICVVLYSIKWDEITTATQWQLKHDINTENDKQISQNLVFPFHYLRKGKREQKVTPMKLISSIIMLTDAINLIILESTSQYITAKVVANFQEYYNIKHK